MKKTDLSIRNGYKNETISKLIATIAVIVNLFLSQLQAGISLCISISNGNKKLGAVKSVSLPPVVTCANCKHCKRYCYAISSALRFKNVSLAWGKNLAILKYDRDLFFAQVLAKLSDRCKHKYFRWHVSGEIVDYDYFCRMVEIAKVKKDWTFWTYTKMYGIVNKYIRENGALPVNLHVMFSIWFDEKTGRYIPINNPYNLPVFTCRPSPLDVAPCAWHCPGNCQVCINSGHGCAHGESSFIDLHQ